MLLNINITRAKRMRAEPPTQLWKTNKRCVWGKYCLPGGLMKAIERLQSD